MQSITGIAHKFASKSLEAFYVRASLVMCWELIGALAWTSMNVPTTMETVLKYAPIQLEVTFVPAELDSH